MSRLAVKQHLGINFFHFWSVLGPWRGARGQERTESGKRGGPSVVLQLIETTIGTCSSFCLLRLAENNESHESQAFMAFMAFMVFHQAQKPES